MKTIKSKINTSFNNILKSIELGVNIEKALRVHEINSNSFYAHITEEQYAMLYHAKALGRKCKGIHLKFGTYPNFNTN